jgi:hypothetical protein
VGLDGESNSSSLYILYTMVQFTRIFTLLAVVATGLAVSVKRSGVITVEADLTIMAKLASTLADTIDAFKLNSTLPKWRTYVNPEYTVVLGDLGDFRILCILLVFSVYPDENHIFCTLDTPGRLS